MTRDLRVSASSAPKRCHREVYRLPSANPSPFLYAFAVVQKRPYGTEDLCDEFLNHLPPKLRQLLESSRVIKRQPVVIQPE